MSLLNQLKNRALKFESVMDGDYEIQVREMTVGDQNRFYEAVHARKDDNGNVPTQTFLMCKLVACMVDPDGKHIAEIDEVESLISAMPKELFEELIKACEKVNPVIEEGLVSKKKANSKQT